MYRNVVLLLFLGLISSFSYAQQSPIVQKSSEIKKIGNQEFYVHAIAKGNTFYSLSKAYNVSIEEIKKANPTLGSELKLNTSILIPKRDDTKPSSATTATPATKASSDNYFYHSVKQGETLGSIAKIYDVTVEDLITMNQLTGNTISPGYRLKIPEKVLETIGGSQKTVSPPSEFNKTKTFEHKVKAGETLFSIAKKYGVGLETLKYLNNFTGNSIQPDQVVLIPDLTKSKPSQEPKNYIVHLVQPQEGLFAIARKYGITVNQIKEMNSDLTDAISIGQEIKIPRTLNEKGYIEHTVGGKKEKLANLARDYEISVADLKDLNPELATKLKQGQTVLIPVDFVDNSLKEKTNLEKKNGEENPKESLNYEKSKRKTFNVALMLPLYLDEIDSLLKIDSYKLSATKSEIKSFRFLEFYEGAMMAVDSMRQLGMKINLRVYDVSEDEMETTKLLQKPEFLNTDLIISLLFSRSFSIVSKYSKEHKIPLVNTLSKRSQIVFDNPYVFKISPKPEAFYQRVAEYVAGNFSNSNIFIVRSNAYEFTREYNELNRLLQEKLNTKNPFSAENKITTIHYATEGLGAFVKQANASRNNVLIAIGSEEVFAVDLFTKLNVYRDKLPLKVIGLPDWSGFENVDIEYSQAFGLSVLSENFVDYSRPEALRFVHLFQEKYHKIPEIDTYAFLGYDAAFYFLQAMYRSGDDWLKQVETFQIPLLQNQLKFEKQNNQGYENVYWNIYRQENYSNIREK